MLIVDKLSAGDNEVKLMTKHAPEWVRISEYDVQTIAIQRRYVSQF